MVLKTISPGCGVRASLMLFFIYILFAHTAFISFILPAEGAQILPHEASRCFSVISPEEKRFHSFLILRLMSLYSFLSILLSSLAWIIHVRIPTYCASLWRSSIRRYIWIWPLPAFLLSLLCHPSTSLFVLIFCWKMDQVAGRNTVAFIYVDSV